MLLDLGELLCEPLVLLCVCSFGEMAYTVKRKSQFEGQDKGIARTRKLIENMAIYWGKRPTLEQNCTNLSCSS